MNPLLPLLPPLTSAETAMLERAAATPMLAQVEAWAAVNSGSGNLAGLAVQAGLLADAFAALPGALALVPADPAERMDADGSIRPALHGAHLHLSVRPQAPVQLLFTGHMDTVFGADHPFQTLTWLDSERLSGPGVADMKGGLAILLAALEAIETLPEAAQIGYEVVINSDEEVGSPSSAALITRAARGKRAALTYEPALPDGSLAGARGGSGNMSFRMIGRSAHAGRNPADGRNALLAAADLAVQLGAMRAAGLTCNPARIEGGGPNNVVPDHAVLRINFRPADSDQQAAIEQRVRAAVAAVERAHDVRCVAHGGFGRPPKPWTDASRQLFALVQGCGAQLELDLAARDTGGVCDGNNIAACGVPVIDTMGARGGNIHDSAEYLIAASLPERARLSALVIARLAAGALL